MNEKRKAPVKKSYRSVIGAVAFFLLGLLATTAVKSYRDLEEARDFEAQLVQQIAESESRIRLLREYVRMIDENPLTLERLAREDLGMVKPGDVVIVLPK